MLKGISPFVGPELLSTLYRMGHGDEIVLADAHFPGERVNDTIIRADGLGIDDLLTGIMPLLALDNYVDDSVFMMETVAGDTSDPTVVSQYRTIIEKFEPEIPPFRFLERMAFYERARKAFAVVMTGDTRKYANIVLKKGVTPVE